MIFLVDNLVCPICEAINSPERLICHSCLQDLRAAPLNDFLVFIKNPPETRRKDLIFQFGILKHKAKVSYDALKYLAERHDYQRLIQTHQYYREQIERERSAVSYYLLLFSRETFRDHYGILLLDIHIYFALLKTYLIRVGLPNTPWVRDMFQEGLKVVQDQNEKILETIDDIIEDIENLPVREILEGEWISPPPPPIPAMHPRV